MFKNIIVKASLSKGIKILKVPINSYFTKFQSHNYLSSFIVFLLFFRVVRQHKFVRLYKQLVED